MTDSLMVLTSANRRLASKTFSRGKDGTIKNRSYGNEKHFAVASVEVDGIIELAQALEQISRNRHAFIVRGEPLPDIDRKRTHRRLHPDKKTGEPATFAPAARRWFLVDVDKIACPAAIDPKSDSEGAVEYVLGLLPPELHDAWCVWRFSSSQSVFDDLTLSLHLWFWSETPLDEAALKRWAISANATAGYKLIDPAPFSAVQAHYVALPEFVAPLADPLRRRCGLRQGLDEAVSLIIPEAASAKRPDQPSEAGFVPGQGVAAYLAMIGGPTGNREAIKKAIASHIAIYGGKADCGPLKAAIREALDRAVPGWHDDPNGQRYVGDDHLDKLIEWTRRVHGDQPPRGFIPEPPPWLDEAPSHPGDNAAPAPWRDSLILNDKGSPRPLLANALIAFREAPEWLGILAFDTFHQCTMLRGKAPWTAAAVDQPWTDGDDVLAAEWLQHEGMSIVPHVAGMAIEAVARERRFHPVLDYLGRCKWDGTPRLDEWGIKYLGAPDTAYTRAVSARFMIGAVARVSEPGCKADCMLILEGPQGLLNSTALRRLFSPWFADELADFGSKDAAMQLAGVWLIESAEVDNLSRSDAARIKAFMSRGTDHFRPPYGKRVVDQPRQGVFAGTANHSEYLKDETGGRRFWPLACSHINVDGLAEARDQLWAEARDRYLAGETWWLDNPDLVAAAEIEQGARFERDAWSDLIERHVAPLPYTTVAEVLRDVLSLAPGMWGQRETNRVARCFREMRWTRRQVRTAGGTREWRYYPPSSNDL